MIGFRMISLVALLVLAASGPWYLMAAVLVGYIVAFRGIEAVVIAFMADAVFHGHFGIPLYTFISIIFFILLEVARPYLSLYNDR